MNSKILFAALFLLVPVILFGQHEMTETQEQLYTMGFGIPQQTLPSIDFTLEDLEGTEHTLSDYRGKVVFLNFWATWCGPCRSEMPSMEELYAALGDGAFEMLAVASLRGDSLDSINTFVEGNDHSFPVLIDPDGSLGAAYSVQGIPTTYLIGKDGNIVARLVGAYDWANGTIVDILSEMVDG